MAIKGPNWSLGTNASDRASSNRSSRYWYKCACGATRDFLKKQRRLPKCRKDGKVMQEAGYGARPS